MPLLPAKRSEVMGEEGLLRGGSDEEDGSCGIDGSRKKLRLSKDQSAVLEDSFREHPTLNPVSRSNTIIVSPFIKQPSRLIIMDEQPTACRSQSYHSLASSGCLVLLGLNMLNGVRRAAAEGSLGAAARPAAPAGGGVVPEQAREVRTQTACDI